MTREATGDGPSTPLPGRFQLETDLVPQGDQP